MSTPCVPSGAIGLGDCPAPLRLCVRPGAMLAKDIEQRDPVTGLLVNWPAGMTAWLDIRSGGFHQTYPATVDGPLLRFLVAGTDTTQWPKGAAATIWLQFDGQPSPIVWVEGHIEKGCC